MSIRSQLMVPWVKWMYRFDPAMSEVPPVGASNTISPVGSARCKYGEYQENGNDEKSIINDQDVQSSTCMHPDACKHEFEVMAKDLLIHL